MPFRFASAWLQLCTALGRVYACSQGVDGRLEVRTEYFAAFGSHPDIASLSGDRHTDPGRWHPAHRYFFIVDFAPGLGRDTALACVGTDGLVRAPDGATFDIPRIYRTSGRNIWAPVTTVRVRLEQAGLISNWETPVMLNRGRGSHTSVAGSLDHVFATATCTDSLASASSRIGRLSVQCT
jgi:hypothetical protein